MEAVPKLPMLSFELKLSPSPTQFGPTLKPYIRQHYHEDGDSYNNEFKELDGLRVSACKVARDFTGCSTLKKYYSQLILLQSRFPMSQDAEVTVNFVWCDIFSGDVHNISDIKYEQACILYNIGALHSELGAIDNRHSSEGMKVSCTHFQCAAWAFQHLRDELPQPRGSDTSHELLSFYIIIMLAQAQECILEKSMQDNRKSTIISKVAIQIVDYYKSAQKILQNSSKSDEDMTAIVDIVGFEQLKLWKKFIDVKMSYYKAISYLYQGNQAEEQQKMGERVTYYQAAMDTLNETVKLSKSLDKDEFKEAITFTMDVIGAKLNVSKKENDFVYHEKIPALDSLPELKGASLVKGIPFDITDPEVSGPDIFNRLVPIEVHETSSMYSEEKAKLLRKIIPNIEEKNQELTVFLSSLQLEQLDLVNNLQEDRIPQELVEKCAGISVRPNAVSDLVSAMNALSGICTDVDSDLKEIDSMVLEEEEKEKEYQEVVGKRGPSLISLELKNEMKKYSEAHKRASESNTTLHKALSIHIQNLKQLSSPLDVLQKSLPSMDVLQAPNVKSNYDEMNRLLGKVEEMRQQRSMLENQLRTQLQSDDITKLVVASGKNVNSQELFEKELKKHDTVVNLLEQNIVAQENILSALTQANAKYADVRKQTLEVCRLREAKIQSLLASYDAYEDLLDKTQKGTEFYRKLQGNVNKLLARVKSVCKVQDEERLQILNQKTKDVRVSNTEVSAPAGPKLKDYLTYMGGKPSIVTNIPSSNTVAMTMGLRPSPVGAELDATVPSVCIPRVAPEYGQPFVSSSIPSDPNVTGVPPSNASVSSAYSEKFTNVASGSSVPGLPAGQAFIKSGIPSANIQSSNQYSTGLAYPSSVHRPEQQYDRSFQPSGSYQVPVDTSQSSNYSIPQSATGIPPQSSQSMPLYQYNGSRAKVGPSYQYPQATSCQQAEVSSMYQQYQTSTGYQQPQVTSVHQQPQTNTSNQQPSENFYYQPQISGHSSAGQQPIVSSAFQPQSYQQPHVSTSGQKPIVTSIQQHPQASSLYQQPSYAVSQNPQLSFQQPNISTVYQQPLSTNQQSYMTSAYKQPAASTYQQAASTYQQAPSSYPQPSSYQQPYVASSYQHPQVSSHQPSHGSTVYPQQHQQLYSYPGYQQPQMTPPDQVPPLSKPSIPFSTYPQTQVTVTSPFPQTAPSKVNQVSSYQYQSFPSAYSANNGNWNQQTGNFVGSTVKSDVQSFDQSAQGVKSAAYSQQPMENLQQNTIGVSSQSNSNAYFQHMSHPQQPYQQINQSIVPENNRQQILHDSSVTLNGTENPNNVTAGSVVSDRSQSGTPNQSPGPSPIHRPSAAPPVQIPTKNNNASSQMNSNNHLNSDNLKDLLSSTPENKKDEVVDILEPKILTAEDIRLQKEELERSSTQKDPYSDPDTLNTFTNEVKRYEKFVEGLTKRTLIGQTPLDQKWEEMTTTQDKESRKLSISVARCYPIKNRNQDLMPYDQTRVEIKSLKDDYINASYITGVSEMCPKYIVTQAPLPVTYTDFWMMIWEQQAEIIVCLLSDAELKGHVYWPNERGQVIGHGSIKLSLQSTKSKPYWIERMVNITHHESNITRVVIHIQLTCWPASGLPETPIHLLQSISDIHYYHRQQRSLLRPIVVHCSGGSGRSGILCLLSAAVQDINYGRGIIDVLHAVIKMSTQRKYIIYNKEQLRFCYEAVLYHARDLLMKRGILTNQSSFESKNTTSNVNRHVRHPSEDFILGTGGSVTSIQSKLGIDVPASSADSGVNSSADQQPELSTDSDNVQISNEEQTVDKDMTKASDQEPAQNEIPDPQTLGEPQTLSELSSLMDPKTFSLENKGTPAKKKITKEDFGTSSKTSLHKGDPDDPLSMLDPLWSVKK